MNIYVCYVYAAEVCVCGGGGGTVTVLRKAFECHARYVPASMSQVPASMSKLLSPRI